MIRQVVLAGLAALAMALAPMSASACDTCCAPCVKPVVCCVTPPPVLVEICIVDPCTCCTYKAEVCVPACCAEEAPCLAGVRHGIFGRKIYTYEWSCGHCVDIVVTKHGRVIVRD